MCTSWIHAQLADHHPRFPPHAPHHPARGQWTHPLKATAQTCCTPAERHVVHHGATPRVVCPPVFLAHEDRSTKGSGSLIPGGLDFSTVGPSPQSAGEAPGPRVRSKLLITPVSPFTVGLSPTSPASAARCHQLLETRGLCLWPLPTSGPQCCPGPLPSIKPPSQLTSWTAAAG